MIVKNESKIITRLLESVEPLIDSYCICDTGSTDDTIEIIENFFQKINIKGEIIREPFRDFAYNRTFALQKCFGLPNADYILLLDADMVLEINETIDIYDFKNTLTLDGYYLFQGSPSFFYKNVRIVKNTKSLSYWGVTHEYLDLSDNINTISIEKNKIFINDIGDGGSKQDKFLRDVRLLEQGLIETPNHPRYLFYLANSYRDSKQYKKAIEIYHKRISQVGWKEEVWQSYYSIGNCYHSLDDMPNAIYYWLEAFQYYPERIENLYKIIKNYREEKKYNLAYHFYNIAKEQIKSKTDWDHLFLQKSVYDYYLDYEFSIVGYYCKIDNEIMRSTCMNILMLSNADINTFESVLNNYKYYFTNTKIDIEYQTDTMNQLCKYYKEIENNYIFLNDIVNPHEKIGTIHNSIKCYPDYIEKDDLYWYLGQIHTTENLYYFMFIGLDPSKKIQKYSTLYPIHLLCW